MSLKMYHKGMELPLWAIFGLVSATLSAGVFLVQERVKLNGFVMAFWNKVWSVVLMLPLALYFGLPDNPYFYMLLCGQAILWVISDVIFFNAIPKVGAGTISRILPGSVILTFCLWFLFNPALFAEYAETPVRSLFVVAALCASVYFAMNLRHCPVSWQAVRLIWFVIFASVAGPLAAKLMMNHASSSQGPFAYVLFEALVMIAMWSVYYVVRPPVPLRELITREAAKGGFMVAVFCSLMAASNVAAIQIVDNPGLIPAIKFTDTMIILLYYRLIRHKEKGDVLSGLGIVACAAVIIALKAL